MQLMPSNKLVDHKLSNIQHSLKNDILQEIEAVRKREANIAISGLHPTSSSDKELINKLFSDLSLASSEFQSRRIGKDRHGKPKLLLISFENSLNAKSVLNSAYMLEDLPSYKIVYISPARTPQQHEEFRTLRMELKRRREAGENIIFTDNKVVIKLHRALIPKVHRDNTVTHSSATPAQAAYNLRGDKNSS